MRAQKGYLVGYVDGVTYRISIPSTNKVIHFAFVRFDEIFYGLENVFDIPLVIQEEVLEIQEL